jgi:hypothetical protein
VPIEQASSATQSSNLTLFAQLRRELINLFWPRPSAWAGLAVVWSLILGFTLADREPDSAQTLEFAAVPAPELRVALLHEQQQLLAELMGDKPGANEPEPVKPQPHSRRREEFTNV